MVGRPKRMAAKLAELEERAYQLSIDVGKLCPDQYRQWQADWGEYDYEAAWCRAVTATELAAQAMGELLGEAEERVFGEEVAEDRQSARWVKRGQWVEGVEVPERIKARLQAERAGT